MRFPITASLITLALAACVPASKPVEAPPPPPAAPPAPPPAPEPTGDWQERPLTPGDWSYRVEQGGSVALFGPPANEAALTVRCDLGGRRILFSRPGTVPASGGGMTVRTTFGAVQWPASNDGASVPHVIAARSAGDAALDQIAFSRGRFAIETSGLPTLVLPSWPEVARVIEDCRG
ncbi:hypothetical protein [Sphingobium phenoxybenzoativorans]|uniref:hypothetical protein n=1 Tax=Sphingobium phenoxybenzoativorans TaxID=1592790 RepID=UPI000872EEEF|nr:hypothetical protein [Sphingobium phenoxybenzoativorans]